MRLYPDGKLLKLIMFPVCVAHPKQINFTKFGEFYLGTISAVDQIFTICLYLDKWKSWKFQLFDQRDFKIWSLEILTYFDSGVIFELWAIFNSISSKGMNLKFSVLNNLTKNLQKTDICGNLLFSWLPYTMPIIKKTLIFVIFSYFTTWAVTFSRK